MIFRCRYTWENYQWHNDSWNGGWEIYCYGLAKFETSGAKEWVAYLQSNSNEIITIFVYSSKVWSVELDSILAFWIARFFF